MTPTRLTALFLLAAGSAAAQAQVYRCADTVTYTDKPCDGAAPIDLRTNILDAGTRQIPPDPAPAPAIILQAPPKPEGPASGDLWNRRDAADAEYRSRTGPHRP